MRHSKTYKDLIVHPHSVKFDTQENLDEPYIRIITQASEDLKEINDCISITLIISGAHVERSLISTKYKVQRILQLNSKNDIHSSSAEEQAHHAAYDEVHAMLATEEGREEAISIGNGFIESILMDNKTQKAIQESFRSATVSIWGVFEIYSQRILANYIDENKHEAIRMIENPKNNKLISHFNINYKNIGEIQDDFWGSISSFVFTEQFSPSYWTMRSLYKSLFGEAAASIFDESELRKIYGERNIIAHNRAYIDLKFKEEFPDAGEIGTRLFITAKSMKKNISSTLKTLCSLAALTQPE